MEASADRVDATDGNSRPPTTTVASEQMQFFARFIIPSHVLTAGGTIVCANWETLGYTNAVDYVGKNFAEFIYPMAVTRTSDDVVRAVLTDARPGVPVPVTLRSKAGDRVFYLMAVDRVESARLELVGGAGATATAPPPPPPSPPHPEAANIGGEGGTSPTTVGPPPPSQGRVGGNWVDHSRSVEHSSRPYHALSTYLVNLPGPYLAPCLPISQINWAPTYLLPPL